MDVSGWTIDQKMRLPDWCFGNRSIISLTLGITGAGNFRWAISSVVLPTEICMWKLSILFRWCDNESSRVRFGFRATLPTSEAEMDTSMPVFPDLGDAAYSPPRIFLTDWGHEVWEFETRTGIVIGAGLKLTGEIKSAGTAAKVLLVIVYSGLPTNMAGWLAHNKV